MAKCYALSIKQPWATLVVHGLKGIEVRNWPTARRERILVHAARIPDCRPQAWRHLPEHLGSQAQMLGGFVGSVDLVDCRTYRSADDFNRDGPMHLNDPDWWREPVLYGFTFARPETMTFVSYSGWMRFFPVELEETT